MKQAGFVMFIAIMVFAFQPVRAQQTLSANEAEANAPQAGHRGMSFVLDGDRVFYLKPEDRVDVTVVLNRKLKSSGGKKEAVPVTLQHVRVLGVKPSGTSPGTSVVYLEVEPYMGQYLEAVGRSEQVSGQIWLSLIKTGEFEHHSFEAATWSNLLKSEVQAFPLAHAAPGNSVPAGSGSADTQLLAAVDSRLRTGYRALNVPVPSDKAMFIQPGDRVDILATVEVRGPAAPKKHKATLTVLQNILVLDSRRSASQPGQAILLLAMNPAEVQYAALAWDTAEIQVLSRNKADAQILPLKPTSSDSVEF